MENFKHLQQMRRVMTEYGLKARLTAEFIGTFFLSLTICTAAVHGLAGEYAPFAIASVLMVMIYATGYVSGAHFNPAVTLAVWLRGACQREIVLPYVMVQMIAGVVGSVVSEGLLVTDASTAELVVDMTPAFFSELLFTFALVFVILNVATSDATSGNGYYGAAIALVVLAGALSVGSISGGSFNPAVTGALVTAGALGMSDVWIHIAPQIFGSLFAVYAFKLLSEQN